MDNVYRFNKWIFSFILNVFFLSNFMNNRDLKVIANVVHFVTPRFAISYRS